MEIDDNPGPYCMSFHFDLTALVRSIEHCGLINNPFIILTEGGKAEVVMGYRRILALKSLKIESIACFDLSDSGLPPIHLLLLNLSDNLSIREFNDVEKGMILSRLMIHMPKEKVLEEYMPMLKLPSHEETLHFFLSLDGLDQRIKISIAEKEISLKTIKRLLEMDEESRLSVFSLLTEIKFNFNNQLQLIDYIVDISHKEGIEIPGLFIEKSFIKILGEKPLNNPQKVKRVLNFLRARRYPSLIHYEDAFHRKISQLQLPHGVKISHSPFFESPDYTLEIKFQKSNELKEKLKIISRIEGLDDMGNPVHKD
ncbi:MAG: ParB N-terminal domain-containing protein [Thermodesulfobacteriota bacterium]|nr:ParB N-terminal domain-containing protein [Thermodesulfobacteriota bacterium]